MGTILTPEQSNAQQELALLNGVFLHPVYMSRPPIYERLTVKPCKPRSSQRLKRQSKSRESPDVKCLSANKGARRRKMARFSTSAPRFSFPPPFFFFFFFFLRGRFGTSLYSSATKLPQPKPVNRPLQPMLTITGWGEKGHSRCSEKVLADIGRRNAAARMFAGRLEESLTSPNTVGSVNPYQHA